MSAGFKHIKGTFIIPVFLSHHSFPATIQLGLKEQLMNPHSTRNLKNDYRQSDFLSWALVQHKKTSNIPQSSFKGSNQCRPCVVSSCVCFCDLMSSTWRIDAVVYCSVALTHFAEHLCHLERSRGVHVGSDDGDSCVCLLGVAECEGPLKVHLMAMRRDILNYLFH